MSLCFPGGTVSILDIFIEGTTNTVGESKLSIGFLCFRIIEIFDIYKADNIVDNVVIHRQAGIFRFAEHLCDLVSRRAKFYRDHVYARCKYILRFQITELDSGAYQLALLGIDAASVLSCLNNVDQFLFRYTPASSDLKACCISLLHRENSQPYRYKKP
jgi:hypothetical protein